MAALEVRMRHRALFVAPALTLGLSLTAFVAPQSACGCGPQLPRSVAKAVDPALSVLCTAYPAGRAEDSVRAEAREYGFAYWGTFSEFAAGEGSLEVRPGARPGDACALEAMVDGGGAGRIELALTTWAREQGLRREAPRRWSSAEAGRLEWTVERGGPGRMPDVVRVTYAPPSGD